MKLIIVLSLSIYFLFIKQATGVSYKNTWLEGAKIETKNLTDNLARFHKRNKALGIVVPNTLNVLISTGLDLQGSNLSAAIKGLLSKRTKAFGAFIVDNDMPYIVIPETILKLDNDRFYYDYVKHEIVHYEQWERGDLVFDGLFVDWNGYRKHVDEVLNIAGMSRAEIIEQQTSFPWEKEAYDRHNPFVHSKPDLEKIRAK